MRAIVNDQGTACSETALCESCFRQIGNRKIAIDQADQANDIPNPYNFVRADGNEELECIICGGA